ncbi:50S ribosomal protein L29 [Candidatus Pacearchaeota archaeon]|nr:MAG: 50S ribosomal protein L29 [Candidatus Pacearchaeota archaeon]
MSLKTKEISSMEKKEREKRIQELRLELLKSKIDAQKNGGSRVKEIKKTIARLITFNKSQKEKLKKK